MVSVPEVLAGSYNRGLVAVSISIAVMASYAALDLAGRITRARGRARMVWLGGGAFAMGTGIWSMHYVGMLAFQLPIPVEYDWPTVLLSLLAGILVSAIALFVTSRKKMGLLRASIASVFMGGAIAGMHYIGMAAMRLKATCEYSVNIVVLSVLVGIVISFAALWLTFRFRRETTSGGWRKAVTAGIMGAAIPVVHYTGMAAASFRPSAMECGSMAHALNISFFRRDRNRDRDVYGAGPRGDHSSGGPPLFGASARTSGERRAIPADSGDVVRRVCADGRDRRDHRLEFTGGKAVWMAARGIAREDVVGSSDSRKPPSELRRAHPVHDESGWRGGPKYAVRNTRDNSRRPFVCGGNHHVRDSRR